MGTPRRDGRALADPRLLFGSRIRSLLEPLAAARVKPTVTVMVANVRESERPGAQAGIHASEGEPLNER
jgi:hypothetical protein